MNTAQQNIALLPAWCWGVLPEDKSLIRIKAGETGYYPLDMALTIDSKKVFPKDMTTDEIADELNKEKGITKGQRRAMEWGSIFGWGHGASNPEKYDEKGNLKK